MRMPSDLWIGGRRIGPSEPPFVIAELGYNFNTLDEALASVTAVARAGADAIKLQTFCAETVATRTVEFPVEAGGVNQFDEFKRYEIDEETHRKVFAAARQQGIIPFSTPSHEDDVELLERVGVDLYKIGSDDLTNLPFLRYVARKGKPIILSSGMATLAEVDEGIRTIFDAGNRNLILLHCISNYPVEDPSILNLRVIETFRQTFPVLVGFSDHSTTLPAAIAAVALGAVVIERHFVLDKAMPVPDAFFSVTPAELQDLVQAVREAHSMLGDGFKMPAASEALMRVDTRKGLVARRAIPEGQLIGRDDVIVKRPARGIQPRDLDVVIGRRAKRQIAADEIITWDLV